MLSCIGYCLYKILIQMDTAYTSKNPPPPTIILPDVFKNQKK